jgi:hypothetical protein
MTTSKLILVFLLITTCAYAEASDDILGAWLWQRTINSDGTIETPATTGHTVQLQFSADMSFLKYHNGALVADADWGLGYVWVDINGGLVHLTLIETTAGDRWEPLTAVPNALLELRNMSGGTETYLYTGAVSNEPVTWGSAKALFRP